MYISGKNKVKKCMGLYTRGRGFVFGILWHVMILQFCLETIYFDNNEYCDILLNKFIFPSVAKRKKGMVSVNK